ncbi:hypothetical protein [Nocardiopsis sp. YSL2]|uniref:hypothetical protein n=1 Tax=Nocardiopsis sp. YSL2 TaxID=2939492 RepID=UPI0026F476CD|nr:hypothetical protein [Nocardiopsis sp. YSL2]
MSAEPTYTLSEAKRELNYRECRADGHNLRVDDIHTVGGDSYPLGVVCQRCGRSWDTTNGRGGINLGEATS